MHPALSDAAPAFLAILLSMSATVPTEARKPRKPPAPAVLTAPPANASTITTSTTGRQSSGPQTSSTTLRPTGVAFGIPPNMTAAGEPRSATPKVQPIGTR